ncbi:histidine-phosphotransfer domain, HPT domain-containing protein [Lipomyces arxii]|uniref:histidine-phosphotransfer domain, HPT domain-containing protein n=1 Tax=Lipomyces arxii TaxID=56418 RepID=UPI0034CD9E3B
MDRMEELERSGMIDILTFDQLLEMDDDEEEREFSASLVYGYFEQAEDTFVQMETMLQQKDLHQLSSLGHFLKGSSAAIGVSKVRDSCEQIQALGAHMDETGTKEIADPEISLSMIRTVLTRAKDEYKTSKVLLEKFYHKDK